MILGPDLTLAVPPFFGLFFGLSSDASPERSRDAPDPHPRGLETRFGAILVDFGEILGWIWGPILSFFRPNPADGLQDPAQNHAVDLGNPTRRHKL